MESSSQEGSSLDFEAWETNCAVIQIHILNGLIHGHQKLVTHDRWSLTKLTLLHYLLFFIYMESQIMWYLAHVTPLPVLSLVKAYSNYLQLIAINLFHNDQFSYSSNKLIGPN